MRNRFFFFAFILSVVYSLWIISIGWYNPLLDMHGFRQTQTAISTLFMLRGGPKLAYETPVLGAAWSIPFEFPLFQWVVCLFHKLNVFRLDQTGRLVSCLFFYLSLIPCWMILKQMDVPKEFRWIFLSLLVTSPLYLFWSRTFSIESTALFVGLTYFAFALSYIQTRRKKYIIVAALFGIFCTVKVTTFFVFPLLAGSLWVYYSSKNSSLLSRYAVVEFSFLFLVPLTSLVWWTHFSDSSKLMNPLAHFITSDGLNKWHYGTIAQRLSMDTWRSIFWERIAPDTFGNHYALFFVLCCFISPSRYTAYAVISLLLFALSFLTFINVQVVHNYYQYSNGIFLIAALAFSLMAVFQMKGPIRIIGAALFILSLKFHYSGWQERFYPGLRAIDQKQLSPARFLLKHTSEKDIALIYGLDWSSEIPYYARRRALMDRDNRDLESSEMRESFELTFREGFRLGAVLFCGGIQQNRPFVEDKIQKLNLRRESIYRDEWCEIYFPFATTTNSLYLKNEPAI